MKTLTRLGAGFVLLGVLASLPVHAAKVIPDILPPLRRQITVDTAERLAQRKAPPPVPADFPSPFNPADFDKPDASELAAAASRPGAGQRPGGPAGPVGPAGGGGPAAPVQPQAPAGDRETLESLAAQITPSGMIELRGKPRLMIGGRPFELGTRFTAAFNNQEYELELVAIDRTTFTLRYRGEEITRPIKPVR